MTPRGKYYTQGQIQQVDNSHFSKAAFDFEEAEGRLREDNGIE